MCSLKYTFVAKQQLKGLHEGNQSHHYQRSNYKVCTKWNGPSQ